MTIGIDDEFDYLEEDSSQDSSDEFTPKIKGSSKKSLIPGEDSQEENEEEQESEEEIVEEKEVVPEKPKREFNSVSF